MWLSTRKPSLCSGTAGQGGAKGRAVRTSSTFLPHCTFKKPWLHISCGWLHSSVSSTFLPISLEESAIPFLHSWQIRTSKRNLVPMISLCHSSCMHTNEAADTVKTELCYVKIKWIPGKGTTIQNRCITANTCSWPKQKLEVFPCKLAQPALRSLHLQTAGWPA